MILYYPFPYVIDVIMLGIHQILKADTKIKEIIFLQGTDFSSNSLWVYKINNHKGFNLQSIKM